jgi:hypothetical protein
LLNDSIALRWEPNYEGARVLAEFSDENWAARVDHLCGVLLRLDPDVGRTLAAVVRANAAIQKLLLDLIACSPDPLSRQAIFDVAAWLLENLYNDEATSRPVPTGVASQND